MNTLKQSCNFIDDMMRDTIEISSENSISIFVASLPEYSKSLMTFFERSYGQFVRVSFLNKQFDLPLFHSAFSAIKLDKNFCILNTNYSQMIFNTVVSKFIKKDITAVTVKVKENYFFLLLSELELTKFKTLKIK